MCTCVYVPLCGHEYDSQCSLLITAGFSLYLGNVFPDAMDYLRCAAGAVSVCYTADKIHIVFVSPVFSNFGLYILLQSIPAAVVSFAIATNWKIAVSI